MKVVFLLDNNEYVEIAPEKLQIRQVGPGQSALGVEVTVPVRNEEGVATVDADGKPVTQTGFRPFINYAVNLGVPQATLEDEIKLLETSLETKRDELRAQRKAARDAAKPPVSDKKVAKAAKRRLN
jgi:hypothetical protein